MEGYSVVVKKKLPRKESVVYMKIVPQGTSYVVMEVIESIFDEGYFYCRELEWFGKRISLEVECSKLEL